MLRCLLCILALLPLVARADGAKVLVTHYGRLLNADDTAVDGPHRITVRIWSDRVAGSVSDTKLWEDSFAATPVSKGFYSLVLGSGAELPASVFSGREAAFMTVAIDEGADLSPRLTIGRIPLAAHASASDVADGVRWSGGVVKLDAAGKWPASSLDIPTNLATLEGGKLAAAQLPANVATLDEAGRLPLSTLPSGPSGLDSASVGGHTPADASAGDRTIPLLSGGKLAEGVLPANVPLLTGGRLPEAVLSANVPLLNGGKLPDSLLSSAVPLLAGGKLDDGVLSANVPLLTAGKLNAGVLPSGADLTFGNLGAAKLNVGAVTPAKAMLSVNGALRIGYANEVCDETTNGMLRLKDERLEYCASKTWNVLAYAPASVLTIIDNAQGRRWSDGSFARSCKEYRTPATGRSYTGATGDGEYVIQPQAGGATLRVWCDIRVKIERKDS